jgi:pimeloyl-ACP methyl ester carboxylesterase
MTSIDEHVGRPPRPARHVIPCTTYGTGRPFVFIRALAGSPGNPSGLDRLLELWILHGPLREHSVLAIGCPINLPPDVSMQTLAGYYAELIESRFGGPVPVMGFSTGASIALQLAVDHPQLVQSLIVAAGASRLSNEGREYQRQYRRGLESGERAAPAELVGTVLPSANALTIARIAARILPRPGDPSDLIALLGAEDEYDVTDQLGRIEVPTLVISGERDIFYPPALGYSTARGVKHGRLIIYRRHVHLAVPLAPRFTGDIMSFLERTEWEP